MFRGSVYLLTFTVCSVSPLAAREAQVEAARQQAAVSNSVEAEGFTDFPAFALEATPEHRTPAPRLQPFSAFTEISAFLTNNATYSKVEREEDAFLVATAGASYRRKLGEQVRMNASVRSSVYRYDRLSGLDFQSVDLSAGVAWTPPQLGGAELRARYFFTDLADRHRAGFYRSQAALLGVQKSFAVTKAQSFYGGLNAQWEWANPSSSERDEYSASLGYALQATRSIDADLYYRYARYVYSEDAGRRDNNQVVALTWRYAPVNWASVSATGYFAANRSTQSEFDYDALTTGVVLQLSAKF